MTSAEPAWQPDEACLTRSNVARFANAQRLPDFEALLLRSQEDPEWFWEAAAEHLGLEWSTAYDAVLDTSDGIEWARWFVGGMLNVADLCVSRHAARDADATAIVWEGEDATTRSLSYGELNTMTAQMAATLTRRGVSAGEAIGILMPMVPETVAALMAAAAIGAIAVPLFSGYGPDAIASRLEDAGATAVVTVDGFYRRGRVVQPRRALESALATLPSVHTVLIVPRMHVDDQSLVEARDEIFEPHDPGTTQLTPTPLPSEHPLMLGYTSGTTGRPKGAVHSHAGFVVKVAAEIGFQFDLRPQPSLARYETTEAADRFFWFSDMGWIMGPWSVVGVLALGGSLLLYEGAPDFPDDSRMWRLVEQHGVTILGISPTLVRGIMRSGTNPSQDHDLTSLRILGSSGEPWNETPWRWYFENVGGGRCPVINVSGGTEVGACFLSPHVTQPISPCSLGGPALGMALDVFDEDGRSVRGSVGELVCTQPWPAMTRGLWRDPGRYLETYWSRWDHTWVHGDWASVSDRGEWFLHGRSDDTISLAGKRVGPAEIESLLTQHDTVVEAAAIGMPDSVKGEALHCYVVLRDGTAPDQDLRDQLSDLVGERLGRALRPSQIRFVSALPKTRSSKVLRRLVRAIATNAPLGDLSSLDDPATIDAVRAAQ